MTRPHKQFGQHWLRSEKALQKIMQAAQLQVEDSVLEIGPGTGNLTKLLLPHVRSLTAIEIDRDLCVKLRKTFTEPSFTLIEGSVLDLTLPELTNKVVANIPYNITGPILEKVLGSISEPITQFQRIVLLVQKEIADRLVAKAGHKAYGALSVRVQYLADCEFICDVPAKAFYPPPKVNSAVVCLLPRPIQHPAHNPKFLEQLITLGFATRRKMLRNNLGSVITRDRLNEVLEQMEINPQVRAEDLAVEQWVNLANVIAEEVTSHKL